MKSLLTQPYSNAACKLINHWYRYGYEGICEDLTGKRYSPVRLPFAENGGGKDNVLLRPPYSNEDRELLNHWYAIGFTEAAKGLTGTAYIPNGLPFLRSGISSEDVRKEVRIESVQALEAGQPFPPEVPTDASAFSDRRRIDSLNNELRALKLALCRYSLDQDRTLRIASAIEERAEGIFKEIQ